MSIKQLKQHISGISFNKSTHVI